MSVYNMKADLTRLRVLLTLCKYLAIIPDTIKISHSKKIYPFIWIAVLVCLYIYLLLGKIWYMRDVTHVSAFFTDCACDIVVIGSNVAAIFTINIMNGDNICKFFKKLQKVDQSLESVCEIKKSGTRFYAEFTISHLYFIFYYVSYCYIWMSTTTFDIFKYFFIKELLNYNTIVLALLLRHSALVIKTRFEVINKLLQNNLIVYQGPIIVVEKGIKADNNGGLKKIKDLYTTLLQMIHDYNDIFGWQFLVLYINIIVNLLNSVNIALVFGSGYRKFAGKTYGTTLIFLSLIWASLPLIVAVKIFSACSETSDEAERTRCICFVATRDLKNPDKLIKEDLQEIVQLSSNCPTFSAAGFFTINYGVLFSLIGSIGSYTLVLVQFK